MSYVKVAEYQARGALHFHCVLRLDAAQPKDRADLVEPPPAEFTADLLAEAIRAAAAHTTAPDSPQPARDADARSRPLASRRAQRRRR